MECPLQVVFHNLPPSDAIAAEVRAHAAGLETYDHRIQSCRVIIDVPHRHHRRGNRCRVRIDLKVPGAELVVGRGPVAHVADGDLAATIRDAFLAARRRLEDHVRRRRGFVKAHEPRPEARPR